MDKSILIRNVPDAVYETLQERAAEIGMTLSEFLLAEVERIAGHPTVADVLARAAATRGGAKLEDIVRAVREGRDEPV